MKSHIQNCFKVRSHIRWEVKLKSKTKNNVKTKLKNSIQKLKENDFWFGSSLWVRLKSKTA